MQGYLRPIHEKNIAEDELSIHVEERGQVVKNSLWPNSRICDVMLKKKYIWRKVICAGIF